MKLLFPVCFALLELHGPGKQLIDISPKGVVSLREPRADEGHFSKEVHCLVNTADGKFSAVVEDCGKVQRLIEEERKCNE